MNDSLRSGTKRRAAPGGPQPGSEQHIFAPHLGSSSSAFAYDFSSPFQSTTSASDSAAAADACELGPLPLEHLSSAFASSCGTTPGFLSSSATFASSGNDSRPLCHRGDSLSPVSVPSAHASPVPAFALDPIATSADLFQSHSVSSTTDSVFGPAAKKLRTSSLAPTPTPCTLPSLTSQSFADSLGLGVSLPKSLESSSSSSSPQRHRQCATRGDSSSPRASAAPQHKKRRATRRTEGVANSTARTSRSKLTGASPSPSSSATIATVKKAKAKASGASATMASAGRSGRGHSGDGNSDSNSGGNGAGGANSGSSTSRSKYDRQQPSQTHCCSYKQILNCNNRLQTRNDVVCDEHSKNIRIPADRCAFSRTQKFREQRNRQLLLNDAKITIETFEFAFSMYSLHVFDKAESKLIAQDYFRRAYPVGHPAHDMFNLFDVRALVPEWTEGIPMSVDRRERKLKPQRVSTDPCAPVKKQHIKQENGGGGASGHHSAPPQQLIQQPLKQPHHQPQQQQQQQQQPQISQAVLDTIAQLSQEHQQQQSLAQVVAHLFDPAAMSTMPPEQIQAMSVLLPQVFQNSTNSDIAEALQQSIATQQQVSPEAQARVDAQNAAAVADAQQRAAAVAALAAVNAGVNPAAGGSDAHTNLLAQALFNAVTAQHTAQGGQEQMSDDQKTFDIQRQQQMQQALSAHAAAAMSGISSHTPSAGANSLHAQSLMAQLQQQQQAAALSIANNVNAAAARAGGASARQPMMLSQLDPNLRDTTNPMNDPTQMGYTLAPMTDDKCS